MRLINFLETSARWRAWCKDVHLDANRVRAVLATMEHSGQLGGLDAQRLHVFCTYTPFETLLAYFVASHLGLTVAIVSPRGLSRVVEGMDPDWLGQLLLPSGRTVPAGEWLGGVRRLDFNPAELVSDSMVSPAAKQAARFVFCTSGTTGKAKRVLHDERTLIANAKVVSDYMRLTPADRSYCVFPMQYMYGLSTTLCTLWSDGSIRYSEFLKPVLLAERVRKHDISVLPILGEWSSDLREEWQHAGFAPKRLLLINASDRLLQQQAEDLLPFATEFWNNLGQTESAPRLFALNLSSLPSLDDACHQGIVSVGQPVHPDIHLCLRDGLGDTGNLYYRTPFSMLGYLDDDGSVMPPPEWIESGDLFRQDTNSLWYWVGRSSHSIKIRGEFISLRTVTDMLLSHQDVSGIGYATNQHGELCTFVESPGQCEQLRSTLSQLISDALRGKRTEIRFVDKLPRTESGKIDYRRLSRTVLDPPYQRQPRKGSPPSHDEC